MNANWFLFFRGHRSNVIPKAKGQSLRLCFFLHVPLLMLFCPPQKLLGDMQGHSDPCLRHTYISLFNTADCSSQYLFNPAQSFNAHSFILQMVTPSCVFRSTLSPVAARLASIRPNDRELLTNIFTELWREASFWRASSNSVDVPFQSIAFGLSAR